MITERKRRNESMFHQVVLPSMLLKFQQCSFCLLPNQQKLDSSVIMRVPIFWFEDYKGFLIEIWQHCGKVHIKSKPFLFWRRSKSSIPPGKTVDTDSDNSFEKKDRTIIHQRSRCGYHRLWWNNLTRRYPGEICSIVICRGLSHCNTQSMHCESM